MAKNIYLPPKGSNWDDTSTLGDESDITKNKKPYGSMDILNKDSIEDAIEPPVNDEGEYHHKDGMLRHPETLYLTPGNPRQRSDSLIRQ